MGRVPQMAEEGSQCACCAESPGLLVVLVGWGMQLSGFSFLPGLPPFIPLVFTEHLLCTRHTRLKC